MSACPGPTPFPSKKTVTQDAEASRGTDQYQTIAVDHAFGESGSGKKKKMRDKRLVGFLSLSIPSLSCTSVIPD